MKTFNFILQFIVIVLYAFMTLTMFKRIICRNIIVHPFKFNWNKFKVMLTKLNYYSDLGLFLYCILALIKQTNIFYNCEIDPTNNKRTFFWLFCHVILCTSLLISYRNSLPKILTHLKEDLKQNYYDFTNYLFKRQHQAGGKSI